MRELDRDGLLIECDGARTELVVEQIVDSVLVDAELGMLRIEVVHVDRVGRYSLAAAAKIATIEMMLNDLNSVVDGCPQAV